MTDTSQGGGGRPHDADGLAPVIPLFGGAGVPAGAARQSGTSGPDEPVDAAETWHPTWLRAPAEPEEPASAPDSDAELVAAEKMLMKKLRGRGLSVREARTALRDADVADEAAETVIARFLDLGYLDDEALAEQLIDKAVSRKAQGRQAIAQTLSQRGLPRDVIEIALAALPDDEAERALEFARSKAASMDGLERDVALRRLSGQLARRGYGSSALSAARQALDERSSPVRRVRFE